MLRSCAYTMGKKISKFSFIVASMGLNLQSHSTPHHCILPLVIVSSSHKATEMIFLKNHIQYYLYIRRWQRSCSRVCIHPQRNTLDCVTTHVVTKLFHQNKVNQLWLRCPCIKYNYCPWWAPALEREKFFQSCRGALFREASSNWSEILKFIFSSVVHGLPALTSTYVPSWMINWALWS